MKNKYCSTCTYFLKSNRGSCCNAFHTPQIGAIECVDWARATADPSEPTDFELLGCGQIASFQYIGIRHEKDPKALEC